jgi:hypothetical protein
VTRLFPVCCFCKHCCRNAAPAASSTSNSVALNRAYLTPYSQIQTLQNWLAEVLKHCPDWTSIMRYHSGRDEERLDLEHSMQTRADQFVQDLVTGECVWQQAYMLPVLLCSGTFECLCLQHTTKAPPCLCIVTELRSRRLD